MNKDIIAARQGNHESTENEDGRFWTRLQIVAALGGFVGCLLYLSKSRRRPGKKSRDGVSWTWIVGWLVLVGLVVVDIFRGRSREGDRDKCRGCEKMIMEREKSGRPGSSERLMTFDKKTGIFNLRQLI